MRDFRNKYAWSLYRAELNKGYPYDGTAAFRLDNGYGSGRKMIDEPAREFLPYWAALELKKEGRLNSKKTVIEILDECKKRYNAEVAYREEWKSEPDTYKGYELKWEHFMPYDDDYNAFDHETLRCVLPFRATEEDKKALRELIYIPFRDPYCDGRDCTGARFTGSLRIYTTQEKTFIYHIIEVDC
ncbi:hypothetical protein [Butyrivibrio hungatei]|uniref:Uncharacterized protein n=1 Tax=Butyrivibrio hungatei TaxID=185008 RepID=A0A1D9P715_9FIRM|nr:hypothetical protein [Butyrivibrio hungatei]AOZ97925.1 hypothetical protein bhn_II126 [Butyrivibrio hungatei]